MRCPGQDTQYWDAEAIYDVNCPQCNSIVEFYKDDTQRKCHSCGHRFVNPKMDFGCASYCQFAEQCVGTLPEGMVISSDNLLKDKVAIEMKRFFRSDFRRIGRSMRLARYAEPIAITEGAALGPTLCAAYLLEVHCLESNDQVEMKQTTVEQLLIKAGAEPPLRQQVHSLLDLLTQSDFAPSPEIRTLFDAKRILEIDEQIKAGKVSAEDLQKLSNTLATSTGRDITEKVISGYLNGSAETTGS